VVATSPVAFAGPQKEYTFMLSRPVGMLVGENVPGGRKSVEVLMPEPPETGEGEITPPLPQVPLPKM